MNRESLRFNLALGFLCLLLPPILACTCFPLEREHLVPFALFVSPVFPPSDDLIQTALS